MRLRVILGFTILLALSLVPGLVLSAAGLPTVSSVTTLSALAALIPALFASTRTALVTAALLTLASSVAVPASSNPWLAAVVLAATGALIGIAAHWGSSDFVVLAGISIVFLIAEPPSLPESSYDALLLTAVTAGSALWGVLAGLVIRKNHRATGLPRPDATSGSRTAAYAGVLSLVLGVGGWWTVHLQLQHGGAWFLMTFLIVLQPYLQDSFHLTIHRALGTVAGVVAALAIYVLVGPWPTALYVIGSVCAIAALTVRFTTKRPYWQYVLLLTPAVVLLEGMSTSVIDTAEQRIGFTLRAAAIAVGLEAALAPLYRRSATRLGLQRY